jgi:hypothetical protein
MIHFLLMFEHILKYLNLQSCILVLVDKFQIWWVGCKWFDAMGNFFFHKVRFISFKIIWNTEIYFKDSPKILKVFFIEIYPYSYNFQSLNFVRNHPNKIRQILCYKYHNFFFFDIVFWLNRLEFLFTAVQTCYVFFTC